MQTNPKPTYVQVFYSNAETIVATLAKLYADRMYDGNNRGGQQQRGGFPFSGFGGGRGGGGRGGQTTATTTTGETAKMTLAADTQSNLVIVSAPGPLVREVVDVIAELDSRAAAAPTEDYRIGRCLLYTSPSPRDLSTPRMPSSA